MNVVFDLDGTLADTSHRVHFLEQKPKDWDAFHSACWDDGRITPTLGLFYRLRLSMDKRYGEHLAIWTGRPERCREVTIRWLERACVMGPFGIEVEIRMRPDDDFRHDTELKGGWLEDSPWRPDLVLEDRTRMVEFWRSQGITCYQVQPGDF